MVKLEISFSQQKSPKKDDLSDLDRCRLHFLLGNHIPRRFRDVYTIENTIRVFEHLIDTGKIFSCLSEALSASGKLDWSEKLQELKATPSAPVTCPAPQTTTKPTVTQSVLDQMTDEEEEDSGIY